MKPRIYTDTSVLGGCEDEEFRDASRRLIDAFVAGELALVLSELTLRELESAPEAVLQSLARVPEAHIELIPVSAEAEELAAAYIRDGAFGKTCARTPCTLPLLQQRGLTFLSVGISSTSLT